MPWIGGVAAVFIVVRAAALASVASSGSSAQEEPIEIRVDPLGTTPTLRAAFDEVRAIKAKNGGQLPADVDLQLAAGHHFLEQTLVLTPDDSAGERKITVRGDRNGSSVVSGGRKVDGWRKEQWKGRDAWVADVAAAKGGAWPFRELFVNGERRTRARHPNHGCLAVAGLADADAAKGWSQGVTSFRFAPGDLDLLRDAPRSDAAAPADVTVMCRWVESHVRVKTLDFEKSAVELREPTVFKLDPGDVYYLDGAAAFLDEPGEWWLDEKESRVWYLPMPDEEKNGPAEVIAPRLERLVSIEGEPAAGHFVERVLFELITFAHAGWWFPAPASPDGPRTSGFPQASVGVPAAIEATGAAHCRLFKCAVEHVGGYAIALDAGCHDNRVELCTVRDLGAGGVKIGTTSIPENEGLRTFENHVQRCDIGNGGRIFHSAVGIWIGQSPKNQILFNEVHDFLYTGISIGWTWGYGPATAGGNSVIDNDVHHIGKRKDGEGPWLSDMGGIYTLGAQCGTVIWKNRFADVAARTYGGWGIYFDEGSSEISATRNLVERTTHGGFHQHYGKENLVEGNVFAFGRDAQIQRSRCEPHVSFRFRGNVVLFDLGELFAGDFSDGHFDFTRNLYWRTDGKEIRFAGRNFEQWQAAGFDARSAIEDPALPLPLPARLQAPEGTPARRVLGDAFVGAMVSRR